MKYLFFSFLIFSMSGYSQSDYAREELKLALSKKEQHNVIDNKTIILKDSEMAVNVAETILFGIYGKENIEKQKPYYVNSIDNYWVISGRLREGWTGGTFLIIIDSRNSKVIKITHGK